MEDIILELEKKFTDAKKKIGFKASLGELDRVFYIKDFILKEKYVSENLINQISSRISEVYVSWIRYLNALLLPNPGDMIIMAESKIITESDKKEIWEAIKNGMGFVSENSLIGLNVKEMEKPFVDESLDYWNKSFHPLMIRLMKKVHENWKK